jgi:hypothetical protein
LQLAPTKCDSITVVVLKVLAAEITGARAMNTNLGVGALFQRQRAAAVVDMNMRQ